MTYKETIQLFSLITTLYPGERRFADAGQAMLQAWTEMLQDLPFARVAAALKQHTALNRYPPSISELRGACVAAQPQGMSAEQAWAKVLRAVKNSSYYAQRMFDELPPICQRLVGSAQVLREWAQAEGPNALSVPRSQFLKGYAIEQTRQQERSLLPPAVRHALDAAQLPTGTETWG